MGSSQISSSQGVVQVDQNRLLGFCDGLDVVDEDLAVFLLHGDVLVARKDVLGVREGRHPATVEATRVPAAVVGMQVGTEHVVDIFGIHAGRREIG